MRRVSRNAGVTLRRGSIDICRIETSETTPKAWCDGLLGVSTDDDGY
jgi:hypothetical protein